MAGHGEKGEGILRGNLIMLSKSNVSETAMTSGVGMIKLSGVKLYLNDGSAWNLISSA